MGLNVVDILRPAEDEFKAMAEKVSIEDNESLAAQLKYHPRALERPIVVDEDAKKAVIGRPPENVLELLK